MVTKFCQLPVHLGHLLWHVFLKESHVDVHLTLYLGHPLVHTVMEFPCMACLISSMNASSFFLPRSANKATVSAAHCISNYAQDHKSHLPAISAPSLLHRLGDNKARFSEAEAKSLSRSPSQPRDRYRINDGIRRCYFQQASHLTSQDTENNKRTTE